MCQKFLKSAILIKVKKYVWYVLLWLKFDEMLTVFLYLGKYYLF
jgi:hypothetical protein